MKSSKVLYSTLAASALLAAGFATVAHADDAVPASSTPESAAVTPATSSSAPEATTPASETPASAQPTTPASSSATPASSASSSTSSSASSTTASEPASSAETAASSATDTSERKVPITLKITNVDKGGININATVSELPLGTDGYSKNSDIRVEGVYTYVGGEHDGEVFSSPIYLAGKPYVYFDQYRKDRDFSTDPEFTDGTYKLVMTSKDKVNVVDGRQVTFEGSTTFTIKNGRVVTPTPAKPAAQPTTPSSDPTTPATNENKKNDPLWAHVMDLTATVVSPDKINLHYSAPKIADGEVHVISPRVINASTNEEVSQYIIMPFPEVNNKSTYDYSFERAKGLPDGVYFFRELTRQVNNGDNYDWMYDDSNTFEVKDGKYVVPVKETSEKPTTPVKPETQPTTPSSEPTTPASQPTTPSSEPTTPASEPTTPVKPAAQPTTPSSQPTTPGQSGKQEQPASEEVDGDKGKDKEKNKDKGTQPSGNPSDSKESKEEQKGSAKPSAGKGTSDKGDGNGREVYPLANTTAKVAPANNAPKKASLPNTGEKASVFATVAGILVAGLAAFTFKRKEN